jgi:2-keto-3-deoxy-6-phosphogluconate aldolase
MGDQNLQTRFSRSLDHAPVIARIDAQDSQQAYHLASAVHTGGFQLIAFQATLPAVSDMVAAFSSRSDVMVGAYGVSSLNDAEQLVERGAGFIFLDEPHSEFEALASRCDATLIPSSNDLIANPTAPHGYTCLDGLDTYSTAVLTADAQNLPANLIVAGRIGGDELGPWIGSGARAICLQGALYSPEMVIQKQFPAIRNLAAAAHQEATRHSRSTRGN